MRRMRSLRNVQQIKKARNDRNRMGQKARPPPRPQSRGIFWGLTDIGISRRTATAPNLFPCWGLIIPYPTK